eukprot:m.11021 g.11021  ORF g.11021 m.11021 type:complete len:398 (-) comp8599_c0_seq1:388-1581(-)
MGGKSSTPVWPLTWAHETNLLNKGIAHHNKQSDASPVFATVFDVELPETDHNEETQHIHTVWYRRGSPTNDVHVEHLEKSPQALVNQHVAAASQEKSGPLVMLHGYGSGAGIYYAAAPAIASRWKGPVFAIDSLGCGLSSRPHHNPAIGYGKAADLGQAERFFVDGLEQWRKAMNFDKITIVGHSLGGYISTCYSERYPENVEKLILVGCAGIPEKPQGFDESLASRGFLLRTVNSLMTDKGWSPFTLVKYGPGSTIVGGYVKRRFQASAHVPIEELHQYIYQSWTGGNVSTGGYSHNLFLGPMAYAKSPLVHRIPEIKLDKISFVYGETDWMNPKHAFDMRADLEDPSSLNSPNADVFVVSKAGHNVMVDNPEGFVNAIMTAATSHSHTSDCLTFD